MGLLKKKRRRREEKGEDCIFHTFFSLPHGAATEDKSPGESFCFAEMKFSVDLCLQMFSSLLGVWEIHCQSSTTSCGIIMMDIDLQQVFAILDENDEGQIQLRRFVDVANNYYSDAEVSAMLDLHTNTTSRVIRLKRNRTPGSVVCVSWQEDRVKKKHQTNERTDIFESQVCTSKAKGHRRSLSSNSPVSPKP